MIKVIFLASWGTPQQILDAFKVYTPKDDGVWRNICGTSDMSCADFVVVLDDGNSSHLSVPNEKIIYLQREPQCVKRIRWSPEQRKDFFFNGTFNVILKAATPWVLKPYNFLKHTQYTPRHNSLVAICSGKTMVPAHKQRLAFLKYLAQKLPKGVMHVYGRGLNARHFNGCYHGEIKGKCKYDTLSRYRYCLALENEKKDNYVTEKIYDCFLSLTMPIYWGAENIFDYFPSDSVVIIKDMNMNQNMVDIITKLVSETVSDKCVGALQEAKRLTMDEHNMWPQLHHILGGEESNKLK